MNKKLVSIVMSAATLVSGAVFADCEPQFYVGAEAQTSRLNFEKQSRALIETVFKKTMNGGGVFLGSRFNENLGLEAGYTFVGKQNIKFLGGLVKLEAKMQNTYLDLMGYLPMDCAMDLIGSVGVGYLHTDVKVNALGMDLYNGKNHDVGARAGVGAQYRFTDNVGARVMVNYQHAKSDLKHIASAKLGMFYQF